MKQNVAEAEGSVVLTSASRHVMLNPQPCGLHTFFFFFQRELNFSSNFFCTAKKYTVIRDEWERPCVKVLKHLRLKIVENKRILCTFYYASQKRDQVLRGDSKSVSSMASCKHVHWTAKLDETTKFIQTLGKESAV